jgi:hypothetical protein
MKQQGRKNGKASPQALQLGLGRAAHGGTETLLELVDPTFGIHKLLLTRKEGV